MRASTSRAAAAGLLSFPTAGAALVSAHSFPESEAPAAGQTLDQPPSEVRIKYDAPIEKLFAQLAVIDSNGQNLAEGAPTVSDDGYILAVKVPRLNPGNYVVKWRVVGIDTHHTEGSYSFSVAGGS
jgi:methionine-rich copper-binding protein CopC